jgi:WhiB family transcriptional regulator, redox-sensing transcriptional regulator
MADVTRLPGAIFTLWEWQASGACRGADGELFFHPENARGSARTRRESAAKRVCGSCPVVHQCREHALETREPYGVWGGLTESERARMLGTPPHRRMSSVPGMTSGLASA